MSFFRQQAILMGFWPAQLQTNNEISTQCLVPPFGPIVNVNGAKDFNDFETKNCKIKVDATPTQKPHHFDNLYVEFNPPVFQHHSHVRPSEQLVFILTKMIVVTVFYNAK